MLMMSDVDRTSTFLVIEISQVPAGNYMFKVNNRNTGIRCKICSKLTIKIQ